MSRPRLISIIGKIENATGNIGDGFIRLGLVHVLNQIFPANQPVGYLVVNKFCRDDYLRAEKIIMKSDLAIVAGTPQYRKFDDSDWYDGELYSELLPRANVPAISIAGGAGHPNPHTSIDEFVRSCIDHPKTKGILEARKRALKDFIVRDAYAQQLLHAIGIEACLLPCTAIFSSRACGLTWNPQGFVALVPPSPDIVPSWLVREQRPEFKDRHWHEAYVDLWEHVADLMCAKYGRHKVITMYHDLPETQLFMDRDKMPNPIIINDGLSALKFYSQCDVVLSGRVHGAVSAHGLCGPRCVCVSVDSRAWAATACGISVVNHENLSNGSFQESIDEAKPCSNESMSIWMDTYRERISAVLK